MTTATGGVSWSADSPIALAINARYHNGVYDEFRFSNTTRPAGWIGTDYNNQSSPGTFLSEGSQQTAGGGVAAPGGDIAAERPGRTERPAVSSSAARYFAAKPAPAALFDERAPAQSNAGEAPRIARPTPRTGQLVEDTCQRETYYWDNNPIDTSFTQGADKLKGRLAAVQHQGGYANGACNTTFTESYSYSAAGAPLKKRLWTTRTIPLPLPGVSEQHRGFDHDPGFQLHLRQ